MRYIRAALARIAGVFGKDTADDDLREEMQAHLDMEIAENVRRGVSPRRGSPPGPVGIRWPHRGRRRRARPARLALARQYLGRSPVRRAGAPPQPGVHRRCRHHAGVRHRREHGHLQRRPRRPAQAPASPRGRSPRLPSPSDGRPGRRRHRLLRARDPGLPDRRACVRQHCRIFTVVRYPEGEGRRHPHRRRPRHRQLLRGHGPLAGPRPADAAERRRPGRPAGDGADPRLLDEALRRRLEHRRQAGAARRQLA